MQDKIHIEVTFKNISNLPCVYMEKAVLEIVSLNRHRVKYSRLDIRTEAGRKRFLSLSCSLFGEKAVYVNHRLAPIPGLFINGELMFDIIPSRQELKKAIDDQLSKVGVANGDS